MPSAYHRASYVGCCHTREPGTHTGCTHTHGSYFSRVQFPRIYVNCAESHRTSSLTNQKHDGRQCILPWNTMPTYLLSFYMLKLLVPCALKLRFVEGYTTLTFGGFRNSFLTDKCSVMSWSKVVTDQYHLSIWLNYNSQMKIFVNSFYFGSNCILIDWLGQKPFPWPIGHIDSIPWPISILVSKIDSEYHIWLCSRL